MDHFTSDYVKLLSYEEIYNSSIKPKLEAIDLFLKENIVPFHIYEVAHLLEIEIVELNHLIREYHLDHLDKLSFFTIVLNASSEICKLISRQWRYSTETHYTPEMIAEIYKLNLHKVKQAFADLNVTQITQLELVQIFKRIHLVVF